MKKSILYLGIIVAIAAACSKKEVETPNGFKYTLVRDKEGDLGKPGQFVVFEYEIKDSKDSIWMNSAKEGFPGAYQLQDSSALNSEIGMQQIFRMVSVGDSISINRPVADFFKNVMGNPPPPNTDSSLTMTCNMTVVNILDRDKFQEYQMGLVKEKSAKQKAVDAEIIEKYLKDNSITTIQDTSGIRYVIHNSEGKRKPTIDDCVEVNYVGNFITGGEPFDQNPKLTFPLRQVIEGWQIGIPKLGIGDSATFFVPSGLAYGPRGRRTIPPNSILVFNVKLLAVQTFDPATQSCK